MILLIHSAIGQTVYKWRGEDHSGIYKGKNLLTEWPEAGPALVWEYEGVGAGFGSPTITTDRLYIQGEIDSTGYLFAFDLKGKLLWKKEYAPEWTKTFPGARCCPTIK